MLPWSSGLCSCKESYSYQILLYHLTHNSLERENPIPDPGERGILEKLLVKRGKKPHNKTKPQNPNPKHKQLEGGGLAFQLHKDTETRKEFTSLWSLCECRPWE